ncbi:TetR/AcrR family transcriptional regulator [Fimbriiglobus ruber]|uniref:TetR/AcrR family transcriptional regulator n=1 Tax=Fimbriiglobus ruber TaxID=1908690 RepID=UPI001EE76EBF|nr:TetR/AcrR family transcriptional regulator [Fimbriiglobus ruber]
MSPGQKKTRGRPRSAVAASHDTILSAVFDILQEKSVRDLTIEEVAKRAGVGKPTIYKWWPTKAALVMAMFDERIVGKLATPNAKTAEQAIRAQVTELIPLFNGFFGKVIADIIAEGQSDSSVLEEYRLRYQIKLRAFSVEVINRAVETGEFQKKIDPEVLIDMIYGPIYYRLLVRHAPLDAAFGKAVVDNILAHLKS